MPADRILVPTFIDTKDEHLIALSTKNLSQTHSKITSRLSLGYAYGIQEGGPRQGHPRGKGECRLGTETTNTNTLVKPNKVYPKNAITIKRNRTPNKKIRKEAGKGSRKMFRKGVPKRGRPPTRCQDINDFRKTAQIERDDRSEKTRKGKCK